jgi:two-component system sensor histidine kinase PhoQ
MTIGLRARLLGITATVLAIGLALAGWVLDRSFNASIESGVRAQARLIVFALLGAADERGDSLRIRATRLEPRLSAPGSGLYARVWDEDGVDLWSSDSLRLGPGLPRAGRPPPGLAPFVPGELVFRRVGEQFEAFYAVIWEAAGDRRFLFEVRLDAAPFVAETAAFRRNLMLGLGAVVLLLVAVQALAVALSLKPVGVMAQRVREVAAGERDRMGGDYPPELTELASSIDRFIAHESASRGRYQTAMEDLAHSLKTPLAVLRNALRGGDPLVAEQVERMDVAVAHQLSRARAARPALLSRPVALGPLCERLVRALEKAHADKRVRVELRIDPAAAARCDERDLLEMLGNVLENAYKFCRTRFRVTARPLAPSGVRVLVEDDGPGIPSERRQDVLVRGVRADTAVAGDGIGLAVVVELASSYGGSFSLGESALGGAGALLELP